eukprot:TRINITY_DN2214_c4_g1_i1.p1 TRINITY_DN2214_c4_g1~~TRINITY_DN2214_c4_g1_i1.p1  ORF type:complete len:1101 (+),score=275.99 TRINITY_DN2214_c4_g1_i1:440-3742(+)
MTNNWSGVRTAVRDGTAISPAMRGAMVEEGRRRTSSQRRAQDDGMDMDEASDEEGNNKSSIRDERAANKKLKRRNSFTHDLSPMKPGTESTSTESSRKGVTASDAATPSDETTKKGKKNLLLSQNSLQRLWRTVSPPRANGEATASLTSWWRSNANYRRQVYTPKSPTVRKWEIGMFLVGVALSFYLPYQASFACYHADLGLAEVLVAVVIQLAYWMDIYFRLHLAYQDGEYLETNPKKVQRHYLWSNGFKMDAVGVLPLLSLLCLFGFPLYAVAAHVFGGSVSPDSDSWCGDVDGEEGMAGCSFLDGLETELDFHRYAHTMDGLGDEVAADDRAVLFNPVLFRVSMLLHLVKLPRVLLFAKERLQENLLSVNTPIRRLGILGIVVTTITHWLACLWWSVGELEGFGSTTWVPSKELGENRDRALFQYVHAFYFAFGNLSGVAWNLEPQTILEVVISGAYLVVSVSVYATLIGQVGSLLAKMDMASSRHEKKMQGLQMFFNNRDVPQDLRKRITNYYEYLWSRQEGVADFEVLNDLPRLLKTEVKMALNHKVLEKVPMFKDWPLPVLRALVTEMEPVVTTPGEFLIHQGDTGSEMYFLIKGIVAVDVNGKEVDCMVSGSFFGEMSLLFQRKTAASIRAVTHCDLFILAKSHYDVVMSEFPEVGDAMRKTSLIRQEQFAERNDLLGVRAKEMDDGGVYAHSKDPKGGKGKNTRKMKGADDLRHTVSGGDAIKKVDSKLKAIDLLRRFAREDSENEDMGNLSPVRGGKRNLRGPPSPRSDNTGLSLPVIHPHNAIVSPRSPRSCTVATSPRAAYKSASSATNLTVESSRSLSPVKEIRRRSSTVMREDDPFQSGEVSPTLRGLVTAPNHHHHANKCADIPKPSSELDSTSPYVQAYRRKLSEEDDIAGQLAAHPNEDDPSLRTRSRSDGASKDTTDGWQQQVTRGRSASAAACTLSSIPCLSTFAHQDNAPGLTLTTPAHRAANSSSSSSSSAAASSSSPSPWSSSLSSSSSSSSSSPSLLSPPTVPRRASSSPAIDTDFSPKPSASAPRYISDDALDRLTDTSPMGQQLSVDDSCVGEVTPPMLIKRTKRSTAAARSSLPD